MTLPAWFKGELAGTFVLVFCGLAAVATSVALSAPVGVFQVAVVWGIAVALAIFLAGPLSGAHLNPAITLAFALFSGFPRKRVTGYFSAQLLGAFLAAALVHALFGGSILRFERENNLQRGAPGSEASAMIFGEYFPNPGARPLGLDAGHVTHFQAAGGEFVGTALLTLVIFGVTTPRNRKVLGNLIPLIIGLALTVLICVIAPLTMAGFNPARDLAPRLFSSLAGWGTVPFTANGWGWLTVYVLAPFAGAVSGAATARWLAR